MPLFRQKKEKPQSQTGDPRFSNRKIRKATGDSFKQMKKMWNNPASKNIRRQMSNELANSGIGPFEIIVVSVIFVAGIILMIVK